MSRIGTLLWTAVLIASLLATPAHAGSGCGCGMGAGPNAPRGAAGCPGCCGGTGACAGMTGAGRGQGRGADTAMQADHDTFRSLLDHRAQITRTVTSIDGGVETLTESADASVAERIREHVRAMKARLEEDRPIHRRDPLFAELFRHGKAITMTIEPTVRGARVRETSTDPYVAKLIRAHAQVVSGFLANGHAEMRRNHPVPPR